MSTDDERRMEKSWEAWYFYFFIWSCWKILLKIVLEFSDVVTQAVNESARCEGQVNLLLELSAWWPAWRCECKIRQRPVKLWKLPGLGDRNKCWVSVVSVCHQRKAPMCQRGELRTGAGDTWSVAMCSRRYRNYNTRQLKEGSVQQQKEKGLLCHNRRIRPHPAANGPTVKTSRWFSTGTEETRLQGCSCISK